MKPPLLFPLFLLGCAGREPCPVQPIVVNAMIVRHIAPNNGPGQTSPGYTELVDDHGHVFQLRQCFGEPGDVIEVRCEEKN